MVEFYIMSVNAIFISISLYKHCGIAVWCDRGLYVNAQRGPITVSVNETVDLCLQLSEAHVEKSSTLLMEQ